MPIRNLFGMVDMNEFAESSAAQYFHNGAICPCVAQNVTNHNERIVFFSKFPKFDQFVEFVRNGFFDMFVYSSE